MSGDKAVRLGAIVVIAATNTKNEPRDTAGSSLPAEKDGLVAGPLACVEIAGRSAAERTVERLRKADVDFISVLITSDCASSLPAFRTRWDNVQTLIVQDVGCAISQILADYSQNGIAYTFVTWADTYLETDLLDLFYFHRESRQTVTRAFDGDAPLALWTVDCAKAQSLPIEQLLHGHTAPPYFVRGYMQRLSAPGVLRQFAEDALRGRCEARPCGKEIRPGIWVDDGGEIQRGARIVAPAYIGGRSKILSDVLITRFSSIERDCFVDCGTVIENSSILAGTHIGIWLDVCHAVVSGNRMLSLERDVMVAISDPSLMRSIGSARVLPPATSEPDRGQAVVVEAPREQHPMAPVWQFGANFIQE